MRNTKHFSHFPFWRQVSIWTLFLIPVLCIAPFLFLSAFVNPNAEDLSHSFLPQISSPFYAIFDFYKNKEARLFTHFLYAFNPLRFGVTDAYKALPILLLFFYIFSLLYFLKSIFQRKELRHIVFLVALLIFCIFLARMASPVHALYWMSSSFNYTPPLIMFYLLLGILLKSIRDIRNGLIATKKRLFAGTLLIFGIVLSNEIYILFLTVFFLTLFIHAFISTKREAGLFLCFFAIALTASSLYVFPHLIMPEISHGRISIDKASFTTAIHFSIKHTFVNLVHWTFLNPPLIISSLLFFLFIRNFSTQFSHLTTNFIRVNIFLFLPFVIFMLMLMLFPYYLFREPTHEPQRIFNGQFLLFLTAWIYGLTNILTVKKKNPARTAVEYPVFLNAIIVAALLLSFLSSKNITTAFNDIFTGSASAYDREMNARFDTIRQAQQSTHKTAVVNELRHKPPTIFFPPDPEAGTSSTMWHEAYEKYFNLKQLTVVNKNKTNSIPDAAQ